jgi:hypothetical protein
MTSRPAQTPRQPRNAQRARTPLNPLLTPAAQNRTTKSSSSRAVADLVGSSGIAFADRGTHTLKGIPNPRQLLAVEDPRLGSANPTD